MITLTPPPGNYSAPRELVIDGPEGYQLIVSKNGPDPVLVKTVASSDKYGDEKPYIQYMDDGRGRVILDGAFTKYYNSHVNQAFPKQFLKNCLEYISPVENPNVLVLGDRSLTNAAQYRINGTNGNDFKLFFDQVLTELGYLYEIKDPDHYNNDLDFGFQDIRQYDIIFFMGGKNSGTESVQPRISERAAKAIALFREEGNGLYLCTDDTGFYYNNNVILEQITDARFDGNYNFSPGTTVAYNRALHGDSPLFNNLSPEDVMQGSNSDSNVIQTIEPPENLPVTVELEDGHNSVKLGIVTPEGNLEYRHYYYGIDESPVVELMDEEGNVIDAWEPAFLRQRRLYFKYGDTGLGNATGYVKAGNTVIGIIENAPPGPLEVDWLNTEYTVSALGELVTMTGSKSLDISVQLEEPFEFNKSWSFNREIPQAGLSQADVFRSLNKNEFKTNSMSLVSLITKANSLIYNPSVEHSLSLPRSLVNINKALTDTMPNMLYTPSASDIFNSFHKYVIDIGSHTPVDADFILEGNVLTNVYNAGGACMLINPDSYDSYQSVILSSTDRDDDGIGLVFGMKETDDSVSFAVVELRLDAVNYPRIRLQTHVVKKPITPGSPGTVIEEGYPKTSGTLFSLATLTGYKARNADGFDGWLTEGWKDGVHLSVEYKDENLTIRLNPPGEKPSNRYVTVITTNSVERDLLKGVKGTSGLYVISQKGSRWSNYAIIRLSDENVVG